MSTQYSVEFNAVKFTKYKQGAPKGLLKKVGRWQKANEYGGWENIDYTPTLLTENKCVYECAQEMYDMLEDYVSFAERGDADGFNQMLYVIKQLLAKARGE